MINYLEIFLKKIKLFLFFLIKFIKDDKILFKKYKNDYSVKKTIFN